MSDITREMWEELNAKYNELNEKYEQVRQNEEMYRVALSMTDHTISFVDIEKHTLNQTYNEGDWTGIAVTMENAPESIISAGIIHPSDCDGYRDFYERIYRGEPNGEYTMRVMEENRGWVWFRMIYKTTFDENNKPIRAICFSDDITVEKKAEEKYEQYKNAVTADVDFVWEADLTNDVMLTEDDNFGTVFSDRKHESYTDISTVAFSAIEDPAQREEVMETFSRESLIRAFENAKREVSLEYQFDYKDGRGLRWIHSTAYLMTNSAEDITCIICTNDITERHNEQEALERKAERDSLTGLYNRFAFESRMSSILEEAPEEKHGYLIMDVDDFKHYNDTYGHAFGDTVLQMVADVLMQSFRISDVVGRVGGDEFMVFMRSIGSREFLEQRALNLRDELIHECQKRSYPKTVTISIGGALSDGEDDFKSLYLLADKALYRSKEKGKDCFTLA